MTGTFVKFSNVISLFLKCIDFCFTLLETGGLVNVWCINIKCIEFKAYNFGVWYVSVSIMCYYHWFLFNFGVVFYCQH